MPYSKKVIIWEPIKFSGQELMKHALDKASFEYSPNDDIRNLIYTPNGITSILDPFSLFNYYHQFHRGNTNFRITHYVAHTLENTEGIDYLRILSPYSFLFAVGKAFKFADVSSSIESELCRDENRKQGRNERSEIGERNEPPKQVKKTNKGKKNKGVRNQSIPSTQSVQTTHPIQSTKLGCEGNPVKDISILLSDEKVVKLREHLKQSNKKWAIYVFPSGKYVYTTEGEEHFENTLDTYIQAEKAVGGVIIRSEDC